VNNVETGTAASRSLGKQGNKMTDVVDCRCVRGIVKYHYILDVESVYGV
jgi:hypothetical protein